MLSNHPDPPSTSAESRSTQQPDPSSTSSKRPRLSSRSSVEEGEASDETAHTSVRRSIIQVHGHQRTSSGTRMDMDRSSSPPEASSSGTIKYTRTGRVSKATKGQRVHNCDECGKTYTRAEHLRRHQQNHKPGAFPCDVPGCGRSFHRDDLLSRHKLRHNDPLNPASRRHSICSHGSVPDPPSTAESPAPLARILPSRMIDSSDGQHLTSHNEQHPRRPSNRTPPKRPIAPNELPISGGVPVDFNNVHHPVQFNSTPWLVDRPISPGSYPEYDYESPDDFSEIQCYQPQLARARYHSDASIMGYNQPSRNGRSPMSSGSSSICLPPWGGAEAPSYGGTIPVGFDGSLLNHHPSISSYPCEPLPTISLEERDFMEQTRIGLPSGVFDPFMSDETTSVDYGPYETAYWSFVHPLFPVVHRPTYDRERTSPLLRTAVLALGGQASGDPNAMSNARSLHEKCLKALRLRETQNTQTFRICDMQAIVLVEIYSLFKSRRPPHQFSRYFEEVYRWLSGDPEAISTTSDTPPTSSIFLDDPSFPYAHYIQTQCKQRLLLSCYALEQQHNLLFGRNTTTTYSELGFSLPFPTSQSQWDTPMDYHYAPSEQRPCNQISDAVAAISCMTEPVLPSFDLFQWTLVQAQLCDSHGDLESFVDSGVPDYPITLAIGQSTRARLSYHTLMLCKTTPIRDLLAVAGESWIMAEKLSTQDAYTATKMVVRDWAMKSVQTPPDNHAVPTRKSAMEHALQHALSILHIQQDMPRSGLLFQEWALYLAALVVWAKSYVHHREGPKPRLSIPNPNAPTRSPVELEQSVSDIIAAGPAGVIQWEGSRNVLIWTKAKLERSDILHGSGLVSGALDVLEKLISRGGDDDWY